MVGVALVAGAIALVARLESALTEGVLEAAAVRARELATEVRAGRLPDLDAGDADDEFVQVVEGRQVVASSSHVRGREVLEGGDVRDGVTFATVSADAGDGTTVIVGRALDDVSEATVALTRQLIIGLPLLLALVAAVTWIVTGRALRPVESLRTAVEGITATALDRRVPQPPGHDEVARLAGTLNGMLARLEDATLRQRRFVSDAAHELRNPVASIRQHAEVARDHPDRLSGPQLADAVLADDLRLQQLVEDLLLLARADEGAAARGREVDLDDLLVEEARRVRQAGGVEVDATGVGAARVHGDAAQLRRLLANLLDNAARHARSRVAVSLRRRRDARRAACRRRRLGHPPARAHPCVRALRPLGRGPLARRWRGRPRPGDRGGGRRGPWWRGRGGRGPRGRRPAGGPLAAC